MRALSTAVLILVFATSAGAQNRSISQNEKAQGQQAHPQLLQTFGGAYGGPQDAYVARVGKRVAVQSGLSGSERDFTVTLLNSSANNAFAIPGGYVYVTRQLLALMNDEAELAAVLGHEVGHVAARHSSSRSRTSGVTSVLAGILGAVTGSSRIGQVAGQAAQLYTLRFSRQQELQADDLGVRYLGSGGYDPLAMSTVLASLADQNAFDQQTGNNGRGNPEWASTHPDPASRVQRARQQAQAARATAAPRNREAFLAAIDGMTYGDDPRQGVISGSSFSHPGLGIGFTAPQGYSMSNSPQAVSITGPSGQATFASGRYDGDLGAYARGVLSALAGGSGVPSGEVRRTQINGLEAAYTTIRANSGQQTVDATVFAFQTGRSTAYHFVLVTPAGTGVGPFAPTIDSFRRLTSAEAAQVRTREIDVVTIRSGDTIERLSRLMAYPDRQLDRFLVLNGMTRGQTLQPGEKVKLVIYTSARSSGNRL
jgi:predicted Zn-dependent protease